MPLQIRRGLEAERTQITPTNGLVEGELLYVTDQKKLYIGSGSVGEHQGVVITGYTNNDAKDAAAEIFADGEHTGITFTYDSGTKALSAVVDVSAISGPLVADALQGSVFADDSSLLVDAIDKRFFGNLTGNVTGNVLGNLAGNVIGNVTGNISGDVTGNLSGNVTGDVIGSVFADDSTMLVDGTNGLIVGDISARLGGSLDTNNFPIISSIGNITLTPDTGGRVNIIGDMYSELVYIRSLPEKLYSMAITHHSNDVAGSFVLVQRSRGTDLVPLASLAGDQIGLTSYRGYTGTQYISSAVISAVVDPTGVVSSTAAPGKLTFSTAGDDGSLRDRLTIDKNGTIVNYGQFWSVTATPTGLPSLLLSNTSTVSNGARSAMRRSRGSFDSPTSVLDADVLFRLMWGGHDGTSYRDTASIEGVVSGTVSTGVIPTKLDIKTTNTSGTLITAATVTSEQTVEAFGAIKFATYATPTARDTKFTSGVVQAGMVVFLTDSTGSGGAPKLQVNTDGTTSGWVDLH
jgi:hypothetical protein